jgi:Ser/Thr protein kinase RdoA (MazF antagonist)
LIGSYIARLHRHSEQYDVPEGFARPRAWDWDWVFGEATPIWNEGKSVYSQNELDVFRLASERVQWDLQELGKNTDVFGIIHRDLHLDNFLFHNGEAYAVDFENCGWGYYLFDLTVTLSSLEIWSLEGYGERCAPMQATLLESYQRERPLPEDTQRHLQTFMAMRLVRWVNVVLGWEAHTRPTSFLSGAVEVLEKFAASEGKAEPIDFDSPWWL